MDANEISELKGVPGGLKKYNASQDTQTFSVPISRPQLDLVKQTSDLKVDDHTAFLGMNTSRQSSLVEFDMLKAKSKHGYLSFFPISKNLIAQGQHSSVFRGEYSVNGVSMPCAVKRINTFKDSQALGIQESLILNQIEHPSIITLIDTKNENQLEDCELEKKLRTAFTEELLVGNPRILLILEFCSNGTIWDWLQNHPDKMGLKLWIKWATEIASGIEHVHSKLIIHHDIKPHNILVTELLDIRICDFGNAVLNSDNVPLQDGLGKGTGPYTAPEIYSPGKVYSFPIDMYSTGVVLFTMISQKEPFCHIQSPVQQIFAIQRGFFYSESQPLVSGWKNPDPSDCEWQFGKAERVPQKIVELVMKLCSLNPRQRPTATMLHNCLKMLDL
jgi:serine/threonine protein kinase